MGEFFKRGLMVVFVCLIIYFIFFFAYVCLKVVFPKLNPSNEIIVWLVSKLVLIKKLPNPKPCISPKATVRDMSNLSPVV